MKRRQEWPSVLDALPFIIIIAIAALLPAAIFLGPQLLTYLGSLNLPGLPVLNWTAIFPPVPSSNAISPNATSSNATSSNATSAQPDPDAEKYYRLKNISCATLSKNFLIEATDVSKGEISGIMNTSPVEGVAARSIASQYDYEQDVRTYVRGDWMKKVIETGGIRHTTIWKEGRIYQCNPNCTMHLLGDAGWQAYLDSLEKMRTDCAYFGRTKMPSSVDMSRLLRFSSVGRRESNGFRCEEFYISGNKTYAQSLLASNVSFSEDQRALLWAIAHLSAPVEECLDDGVGITVSRSITFDLTKSYMFDYAPGGYMRISQETNLTYFTNNVPDSFFALPR